MTFFFFFFFFAIPVLPKRLLDCDRRSLFVSTSPLLFFFFFFVVVDTGELPQFETKVHLIGQFIDAQYCFLALHSSWAISIVYKCVTVIFFVCKLPLNDL